MTMEAIGMKRTGGARIGWVNASWPFATLSANRSQLLLNASLIGKYSFTPDQVVGIEKYTAIPVLGWGVKINHKVANYPENIIFWCFGNPENLIREIRETGFVGAASRELLSLKGEAPVRWQALVVIILLWNALLLLDQMYFANVDRQLGPLALFAIILVFIGSVGMFRSQTLQSLVLKPGRKPEEIKHWLLLLSFVSGLMCFVMSLMLVFG